MHGKFCTYLLAILFVALFIKPIDYFQFVNLVKENS